MTNTVKCIARGTLLNSAIIMVAAVFSSPSPVAAEDFYRKGSAPPGELCPLFCQTRPCCPPPVEE